MPHISCVCFSFFLPLLINHPIISFASIQSARPPNAMQTVPATSLNPSVMPTQQSSSSRGPAHSEKRPILWRQENVEIGVSLSHTTKLNFIQKTSCLFLSFYTRQNKASIVYRNHRGTEDKKCRKEASCRHYMRILSLLMDAPLSSTDFPPILGRV